MILVVGGRASGKRQFVRDRLGYRADQMAPALLDGCPVVCDLQAMLRTEAEIEPLLAKLREKEVVICDEIGCGVVPVDPAERVWREAVGRLCGRLAAEAEQVFRLCCGLAIQLKG